MPPVDMATEQVRMLIAASLAAKKFCEAKDMVIKEVDDYMDKLIDANVVDSVWDEEQNDVNYEFTDEMLDELEGWIGAPDEELINLFTEILEGQNA